MPKLAAAQARVVSAETKRYVDVREAYLDRLVLNIYSGSGPTRLWIDDLEVAGFVGEAAVSGTQLPPPAAATRQPTPRTELASSRASGPRPEVPQMSGAVLLLNNRPLFPRAIEYQGEPLGFLKQLGFNAIRLRTLPTSETLSQARELGLWVICPPPMPAGLDGPSAPGAAPLAEIPPEFDCVLAWDLGEGLTGRELDAVKRWAEQVRRADRLSRRSCAERAPNAQPIARPAELTFLCSIVSRRRRRSSLRIIAAGCTNARVLPDTARRYGARCRPSRPRRL